MFRYFPIAFIIIVILNSCAPLPVYTEKKEISITISNKEKPKTIISDSLVYNLDRFAFLLFQNLNAGISNAFISPYSISSAMAMAYFGAGNHTAAQFTSVMGWSPDKGSFGDKINRLNQKIFIRNPDINLYNSLWIDNSITLKDDYKANCKNYLQSDINLMDFKTNYSACTDTINLLVALNTRNSIQNFIQPGIITSSTKMVLTNAIYFYSKWKKEFILKNTSDADFYISPSKSIRLSFMNDYDDSYLFYEDENIKALEIPYSGSGFSALFILPYGNSNFLKAWDYLQVDSFFELLSQMHKIRVDVSIPKFKISSYFSLADALSRLGFTDAFTSDADFSGITDTKGLYFDQVIHKSFIEMNEAGTEASAATGIFIRETALPGKDIRSFVADHPFIFLIRDNPTNTILFIGQVFNPAQ